MPSRREYPRDWRPGAVWHLSGHGLITGHVSRAASTIPIRIALDEVPEIDVAGAAARAILGGIAHDDSLAA